MNKHKRRHDKARVVLAGRAMAAVWPTLNLKYFPEWQGWLRGVAKRVDLDLFGLGRGLLWQKCNKEHDNGPLRETIS